MRLFKAETQENKSVDFVEAKNCPVAGDKSKELHAF